MAQIIDIKEVRERYKMRVITELLSTLAPREERCLRLHFGIGTKQQQSLEEIGAIFNVEPHRIRQIIAKTLYKLQHPARIAKLQKIGYDTFLDFVKDYMTLSTNKGN